MYRHLILTNKLNEKKHNYQARIIYKTSVRSSNHLIYGIGCPTFCDVLFGQYGHYKNIFKCLCLNILMSIKGNKTSNFFDSNIVEYRTYVVVFTAGKNPRVTVI